MPTKKEDRYALAEQIGADGRQLLQMIDAETTWAWLREVSRRPEIAAGLDLAVLRFEPLSLFFHWRVAEDLPPAPQLISSPYDPDARWSKKRDTSWVGYKVHLTETCDDDLPRVITNVETTNATTADHSLTDIIHTHLAERDLLPSEHIVDTGYVISEHLVTSNERQVDLLGPIREEYKLADACSSGLWRGLFYD